MAWIKFLYQCLNSPLARKAADSSRVTVVSVLSQRRAAALEHNPIPIDHFLISDLLPTNGLFHSVVVSNPPPSKMPLIAEGKLVS